MDTGEENIPSDVRSCPNTTPARPNAVPGAYNGLTVPVRPTKIPQLLALEPRSISGFSDNLHIGYDNR